MPNANFEATATLNGGTVQWRLCHTNPNPDNCGNPKNPFPDVVLKANQGNYIFSFKINDQTGKGITFSSDPIWVTQGSQPTGPGVDPQIEIMTSSGYQPRPCHSQVPAQFRGREQQCGHVPRSRHHQWGHQHQDEFRRPSSAGRYGSTRRNCSDDPIPEFRPAQGLVEGGEST
jgi:hypothetical protein